MQFDKFISPKKIKVGNRDFTISQIPAVDALDICNEVMASITKNGIIGITMLPSSVDRKILCYTALNETADIVPDTDLLFGQIFSGHIDDVKKLVIAMVKENFGFLTSGALLGDLAEMTGAVDSAS